MTSQPEKHGPYWDSLALVSGHLHDVPPEVVESQLVTFDMFIELEGDGCRAHAAQLLGEAASRCLESSRRERLLRAAESVLKKEPCAVTEEGLTHAQAAAAQTISLEEWEKQKDSTLQEPKGPPPIPHFGVWDLFPGLAVRIGRTFKDCFGQKLSEGEILHFLKLDYLPYHGGYTLKFQEKEIRLAETAPDIENDLIIENEGNSYFQPIPNRDSLLACYQLIHQQWNFLRVGSTVEHAVEMRAEIDASVRWLKAKGDPGPVPVCVTAPWAVEAFPHMEARTTNLALRITFLFAGIANLV